MLINAYRDRPAAIPGTRQLEAQLGIEGVRIVDPINPRRVWKIESAYLPVSGRAVGGIRVLLRDQKDFVSFCNQRDLEVLLGDARPGEFCPWLDRDYVDPSSAEWLGIACDDEDLRDDLFERECNLRARLPMGVLTTEYQLTRRAYLGQRCDVEDLFVLLGDVAPETGQMPDTRLSTIEYRWMRAERTPVRWEKL